MSRSTEERMAEHATEHLNVTASPERCVEVALDFEQYPSWAPDIKGATVLARDEKGRGTRVAFRAAAMGRSASYVLEYSYGDDATDATDGTDVTGSAAARSIRWTLLEGDIMRVLDGSYVFEPAVDGTTDITYRLTVDLVVPIPGFVKRRAEGKIMGTALRELKHRVESLTV